MKSVKKVMRLAAIPAMIVLGLASSVNAQTITIESDEGQRSTSVGIDVDFTPGATPVAGYNTVFSYDPAILSGDPTVEAGAGACTVDPGTSTISVIRATFPAAVIGAAERICTVNFPIGAAAAFGDYPLTHDPDPVQTGFTNTNADAVDGTVVDGQITISDAPPDVVLAFNPTTNVVFPGGVSGTTSNASIAVTAASGTIGTGTIDNCVVSGPNASAFSVVAPGTASAPPPSELDLEVTLANSALSATLTCDLDDASAATTKVFQLSAPAGTPVPAPEYSSTPAVGTELTCNGSPGDVAQTSITITNTGLAGAGSDLTFNCAASGAGFSVLAPAGDTLAVGESAQVTVECVVPAEDAPAIEGDLDCTSNDPAAADNNYPLSSVAQTALPPIAQPNVVPASSLWSQLSLIGLMAALGLLVVGLRRKG